MQQPTWRNPFIIHSNEIIGVSSNSELSKVFEITERNNIDHIEPFAASIRALKSAGFRIAIDDAGAMYSGLNLITDTQPHYVKLDRQLIGNIDLGRINDALVIG